MTFTDKAKHEIHEFLLAFEYSDISLRIVATLLVFFGWILIYYNFDMSYLFPISISDKFDINELQLLSGYAFAFVGLLPASGKLLNQRISNVLSLLVAYSILTIGVGDIGYFNYGIILVILGVVQVLLGLFEGKRHRNSILAPDVAAEDAGNILCLRHPISTYLSVALSFLLGGYSLSYLAMHFAYGIYLNEIGIALVASVFFSILLMNSLFSLGYKKGRAEKLGSGHIIVYLFNLACLASSFSCMYLFLTQPWMD